MLEGLGWVTHWFYLPLALFIPTSQMIIHSEFNFIYQFLIHTELMGDLGILGNILIMEQTDTVLIRGCS